MKKYSKKKLVEILSHTLLYNKNKITHTAVRMANLDGSSYDYKITSIGQSVETPYNPPATKIEITFKNPLKFLLK